VIPNGDEVCEIIRLLASIDRHLHWVESAAWLMAGCLCGGLVREWFLAWREQQSMRQYQEELERISTRVAEKNKRTWEWEDRS
jgi:hypothetical protein